MIVRREIQRLHGGVERREVGPRLEAAVRALEPHPGEDLRGLRVTALAFKLAVRGPHPFAVVHAVDQEGTEHWLAIRAADARNVEAAYLELLGDIVRRGLTVARPLIVDVDRCAELGRRVELALGPVVHVGAARAYGGCGLAW